MGDFSRHSDCEGGLVGLDHKFGYELKGRSLVDSDHVELPLQVPKESKDGNRVRELELL